MKWKHGKTKSQRLGQFATTNTGVRLFREKLPVGRNAGKIALYGITKPGYFVLLKVFKTVEAVDDALAEF